MTPEERSEYMKRYRAEHREELNANRRYYYKKHKKQIIAQNYKSGKKWRAANQERLKQYRKKYYEEHKNDPEFMKRRNASSQRWIEKNREKFNAYQREYRRKRRAMEKGGIEEK